MPPTIFLIVSSFLLLAAPAAAFDWDMVPHRVAPLEGLGALELGQSLTDLRRAGYHIETTKQDRVLLVGPYRVTLDALKTIASIERKVGNESMLVVGGQILSAVDLRTAVSAMPGCNPRDLDEVYVGGRVIQCHGVALKEDASGLYVEVNKRCGRSKSTHVAGLRASRAEADDSFLVQFRGCGMYFEGRALAPTASLGGQPLTGIYTLSFSADRRGHCKIEPTPGDELCLGWLDVGETCTGLHYRP